MNGLIRTVAAVAVIISVSAFNSSAQQDDRTTFENGPWTETAVDDGITLRQCLFDNNSLFGSNQALSVITIAPGYGHYLDIIEAPDETLVPTTGFAADSCAIAAVNGSYFKMRHPFGAATYTRVNNEVVGENAKENASERWTRSKRQNGSVAIYKGEFFIVKADCLRMWEKYIEAEDVLTSGPLLMIDGNMEPQQESSFNKTRHPRTVVGKRADGTVVLVIVDGRANEAAGMSTWELQKIMSWLGCKDALNLDGGGSSTMVVKDEIVNHPCDNKTFDNKGERRVANAIIVR